MRTSRIIMLVIGSLLILMGLGLAAGAAAVGVLNARQSDDGFLSLPEGVYEVDTYAITTPEIEVGPGVRAEDAVGTLQIEGRATDAGTDLFIGIGPEAAVEQYLLDVQHSELQEVSFDPFRAYYEERQGSAPAELPGNEDFWVASTSGSGEQSLEWNLDDGDWTVVVMNADGSSPVSAQLQIGARTSLLGPLTWILLISSIVLLVAGIGLAVAGAAGLRRRSAGPGGPYGSYSSAGLPGQPGGPAHVGPGPAGADSGSGPDMPAPAPQTYGQMQDRYGREQQAAGRSGPGGRAGAAVGASAAGATAAGATATGRSAVGPGLGVRDPGLAGPRYPARLYGELDPGVSRWMWLVKWFLAIPHYIVLFFLWIAFFVSTVIAGIVILFTGRYPRGLFDFNVGVVRWSWRVTFYATRVLGTDRYPPFTLERTDYPADFSVDYPRNLSRWLVLVKWWLLVIPQALVVSAITEGTLVVNRFWRGGAAGDLGDGDWTRWGAGMWQGGDDGWADGVYTTVSRQGLSLLGLLVLIAALTLLFTGRYPRQLFNLLMGLNRWTYRVLAYAALMRDEYPPFRLDQGPADRRDEAAGLGRPGPDRG
ncbi:DUF4389 domain-containing protein [Arthrobacter sp. ATA002]|uniref:DUF4389 domain-containing protein n=1 Tax=Arthrobacter sp. ATA002 TaxID=2991715 RepID=UPI0022A74EF0|nr:DUF4389 domain-containing protein [Arthrobacter sp. ATA002]WAP53203.1 DUF4389 domain-containing protein [Arthrobacter sp. ATA002]